MATILLMRMDVVMMEDEEDKDKNMEIEDN